MPDSQNVSVPEFLYGTAWKEDRTRELTLLALRAGFRGIDTANQRRHYNEAGVGEALIEAYDAGVVCRADLFLQTKFTYRAGQDHRLPYDASATLSVQVEQSMASSLDHLGTDYVDSYLLHGPQTRDAWTVADAEVWAAMSRQQKAGRTRCVGVSNVGLCHLQQMLASACELPAYVQNRCFAVTGWDYEVRHFCSEYEISYQGFSLLTANPQVLSHPRITTLAAQLASTPAQVIFAFARGLGMLPITGTSDHEHMRQDLASQRLVLSPGMIATLEREWIP